MNKNGKLICIALIAFGCVCALIGLYGLILFNFASGQLGGGDAFNTALENLKAAETSVSAAVNINLFLATYKYILLIIGGACAVSGAFVLYANKWLRERHLTVTDIMHEIFG